MTSVTASMPGYLPAQKTGEAEAGQAVDLGTITLLGGDADHDGDIDADDLSTIADHFNTTYASSDINNSGLVDIYDLVLAGKNFGKAQGS